MITLPFTALNTMLKSPKLLALGFFPGAFTLLASAGLLYGLWVLFLHSLTLWISLPVALVSFLLCWLAIGRISLFPVEDAIIDECQRLHWGDVRIPGPPLSVGRLLREMLYALVLGFLAVLVFVLGFIPLLSIFAFVLAGLLSAYSFLTPIYARKSQGMRGRFSLLFENLLPNLLLGMLLNVLLFVPGLNVFLLGYAQIFATFVFMKREEKNAAQGARRIELGSR